MPARIDNQGRLAIFVLVTCDTNPDSLQLDVSSNRCFPYLYRVKEPVIGLILFTK